MREIKLGDVTPTRDFNYVEDICRGFEMLMDCKEAVGKVVNIGSNFEISIEDTFNLIKSIMKVDARLIKDEERMRPAGSEVFRLKCDNKLIEQLVGYKPQVNFEQGLSRTVQWFTNPENLKRYKAGLYNV
jgi:nucleoside-diphosphate-sugar epimerase